MSFETITPSVLKLARDEFLSEQIARDTTLKNEVCELNQRSLQYREVV